MLTTGQSEAELLGSDLASLGLSFDHIGVVAPDLQVGQQFFSLALGVREWTPPVDDPSIGVSVQFGRGPDGPTYELISPLGTASPIANALRGNKHILNHFAYRTFDLARAADHLRELGCAPVGPARPAVAYAGERIQFWITPMRFLLELIEAPAHQHTFDLVADPAAHSAPDHAPTASPATLPLINNGNGHSGTNGQAPGTNGQVPTRNGHTSTIDGHTSTSNGQAPTRNGQASTRNGHAR